MMYDDFASRIVQEYDLFLFSLTGKYLSLVAPGVEITPRAIADLRSGAQKLAETFYGLAEREIDNYLHNLPVEGNEALQSDLVVRKRELLARIRIATSENVKQVTQRAMVGKQDYTRLLSNAHGAIGMLAQARASSIDFQIRDTSGRRWQAKTLMRIMARDFAYQSWLDVMFAEILNEGDLADVRYDDASRDFTLSITGATPGYPKLAEIRAKVFHPNATATVEAHVQAE